MPDRVTVEILDRMRPNLASLVMERAKRLPGMRFCDLRLQVREERGAVAENGNEKGSAEDYVFDFGVRVIAGARNSAPGFYGRILGSADADNIESVVWEGIRQAHQRARASSRLKRATVGRLGSLGQGITSTNLAPVRAVQDTLSATYVVDPRTVPLSENVKIAVDGCKAVQGQSQSIVYAATSVSTFLLRELYLSSDGAEIDQSFAQTEGFAIAICSGEHGNYELYDFTGHQRGWEVLTQGYDNGQIVLPNFIDLCKNWALTPPRSLRRHP